MEATVKERLIKYLKHKGIGQTKFEMMAGLSRGYISNIKKEPTTSKLLIILNAAPDLNRTWLETGEGPMLNDSDVTPIELPDNASAEEFTVTSNGTRFLKRHDGQLLMEVATVPIAALGSPEDEYATINENYADERLLVEVDGVHHGKYFAFHVEGDSMDDGTRRSFEAGDTVIVRELPRDEWSPRLHYRQWPFWVVCWGNNVRIKQIIAQDGDTITLHSLNPSPEYCDFTLTLSNVARLFNVVQVIPKIQVWR